VALQIANTTAAIPNRGQQAARKQITANADLPDLVGPTQQKQAIRMI